MSQEPRALLKLLGRRGECAALDRLVADVLASHSRVIVLRGEAGAGKSALLDYLPDRTVGWQVARAAGVESEMELAYAGLHQLCAPMLDHLGRLPAPQRDALATVFGRSTNGAPDQFLVGLATLTLLAEVAEEQPLVCIVDDAQWLDQATAQILGFVARRLLAEPIAMVCAARPTADDEVLAGLPELPVGGLSESDARALLLANVPGPLDAAVCDQIVMESHGNPLALLELPRTWNVAHLAGGFGIPSGQPVAGRVEQSYVRRLRLLPADTQLLVLTAAAEPLGDRLLLHRAAGMLGIDLSAAGPAEDGGLLELSGRVEFAHPLVRSAAYRSAAMDDRHRVHRALADATAADTDPDRRAWHRSRATVGPDEEIAAELERSASRAQGRGGVAAAAAFLQRSAELTPEPARRTQRALAAARASSQAGAFEAAFGLLATVEAGPLDERQSAQADLLAGQIAFASGMGRDAAPLLLEAARKFERFDLDLARETYLDAYQAAQISGHLARDVGLDEVSRAARALPPPAHPRPADLLLDGLTLLVTDGPTAAAPVLRRAARAFAGPDVPIAQRLRWSWMAPMAGATLWDYQGYSLVEEPVRLARETGALDRLPMLLNQMADAAVWRGDLAVATSLIAEADAVCEATGARIPPYAALMLAAYRGRQTEAAELIQVTIERADAAGQGATVNWAHWAAMRLYNGLGRYADVVAAFQQISDRAPVHAIIRPMTELIEAATRTGDLEMARDALPRLVEWTRVGGGTGWALAIEARCRALVADGKVAEDLYRQAIEGYRGTRLRPGLARARLLYGEWLRREGRRLDAREQLRTAHDFFDVAGMEAFAERARRELLATGETARKRTPETHEALTPQEVQIARLARDGLSNPEIGAQLFVSARTVEWHLRHVFAKLGISSRRQLRTALSEHSRAG